MLTHFYRLALYPNNTYYVQIDDSVVRKGSLHKDFQRRQLNEGELFDPGSYKLYEYSDEEVEEEMKKFREEKKK